MSLSMAANAATGFVAFQHFGFFLLETWLWRTKARKVFGVKKELLTTTAPMAAQQGVYNLFLAAGALMSIVQSDARGLVMYPGFCLWAGAFGATSFSTMILFAQALPAAAATALSVAALQSPADQKMFAALYFGGAAFWLGAGKVWYDRERVARKKQEAAETKKE
jgi:putative membrane protein